MIIDNGARHESKIKSMDLDCPPLSGYNHLAIYLRWAYNKGLLSDKLLNGEPCIKDAMEGKCDLREVIANSAYMKGKIRSNDFTEEGEAFTSYFYSFSGRNRYPECVDKNADVYFAGKDYSARFKGEDYLFVPYNEQYYNDLSRYIEVAWQERKHDLDARAKEKQVVVNWLHSVAKTDIRINYTYAGTANEPGEPSATPLTASRIGGKPAVSTGFEWPYYEGTTYDDPVPKNRPLSFMAQINLKEVAPFDKKGLLPDSGILSFFYEMYTQTWGFDPADKGSARVYYFPDEDSLNLEDFPEDMEDDFKCPEFSVEFEEHVSMPDCSEFPDRYDLGWEENIDCLSKAGYEIDEGGNVTKLLGYSDTIQHPMYEQCEAVTRGWRRGNKEDIAKIPDKEKADIRANASEWMLLFQMGTVDSDDYELMFGDSGHIYFWIKKNDLAARNFDNVWLILQCY